MMALHSVDDEKLVAGFEKVKIDKAEESKIEGGLQCNGSKSGLNSDTVAGSMMKSTEKHKAGLRGAILQIKKNRKQLKEEDDVTMTAKAKEKISTLTEDRMKCRKWNNKERKIKEKLCRTKEHRVLVDSETDSKSNFVSFNSNSKLDSVSSKSDSDSDSKSDSVSSKSDSDSKSDSVSSKSDSVSSDSDSKSDSVSSDPNSDSKSDSVSSDSDSDSKSDSVSSKSDSDSKSDSVSSKSDSDSKSGSMCSKPDANSKSNRDAMSSKFDSTSSKFGLESMSSKKDSSRKNRNIRKTGPKKNQTKNLIMKKDRDGEDTMVHNETNVLPGTKMDESAANKKPTGIPTDEKSPGA